MKLTYKGKTAIVTGGASGIGEQIVRNFVDEGCKVAIFDKDINGLKTNLQATTGKALDQLSKTADAAGANNQKNITENISSVIIEPIQCFKYIF